MFSKLSTLLLVTVIFSIFYVVYFFEIPLNFPDKNNELVPDFKFQNLKISHLNDGVLEMEIEADNAVFFKDSTTILIDNGYTQFYFKESGFVAINFPVAKFNFDKNEMLFNEAYIAYLSDQKPIWMFSKEIISSVEDSYIKSNAFTEIYYDNIYVQTNDMYFDFKKNMLFLDKSPIIKAKF